MFDAVTYGALKSYVNKHISSAAPSSWGELQNSVRAGTSGNYFGKGDLFTHTKGANSVLLQLADIGGINKSNTANGNAPFDPDYFARYPKATPLTMQYLDANYGIQFSAPQANYNILTEIASGTACNISLKTYEIAGGNLATYDFTAPQNLIVGGRLRQSAAGNLQYYATSKATPVNIAITAGSVNASVSGKLSVQNDYLRVVFGNNKDADSAVRQLLNSAGLRNTVWEPKNIYDIAPSWMTTLDGFQYGIDPEFLAAVGRTTRETELNTVTDGGGNIITTDKFFLPSRKEIYGDAENVTHKGKQFDLYVGTGNAAKIKYDITNPATPRHWWLRSPHAGNSYNARNVNTDGSVNHSGASHGLGVAPACVIL